MDHRYRAIHRWRLRGQIALTPDVDNLRQVWVTAVIDNYHYYSSSAFETEAELFASGWIFAGMASELAKDHDFVCIDLPGESVVVQNFRGELRAFQNVCPHRLNLIQCAERGNRRLICAYHGWRFDADGRPIGVGERQGFLSPGENAELLCLKRYRVASCGELVFFSRDADALSLEDYLGGFASVIRDLSDAIGTETYFGTVPHCANWKLLVENVLECYHCSAVHPETFVSGMGVGRKPIADVQFAGTEQRHSSSHFPRMPIKREALRKRAIAHLDERPLQHDSFFHIFIFPNLFLSSTEGANFYVGQALPLAANRTDLRIRFFEPRVEFGEKARRRQDALNPQAVDLGLKVIGEDKTILETVQRGISIADRSPALGREEVRIAAFHAAYLLAMRSVAEAAGGRGVDRSPEPAISN